MATFFSPKQNVNTSHVCTTCSDFLNFVYINLQICGVGGVFCYFRTTRQLKPAPRLGVCARLPFSLENKLCDASLAILGNRAKSGVGTYWKTTLRFRPKCTEMEMIGQGLLERQAVWQINVEDLSRDCVTAVPPCSWYCDTNVPLTGSGWTYPERRKKQKKKKNVAGVNRVSRS